MLKGIHPAINPDLLKTLSEMGHGDTIIIADAHFPAKSNNSNVIRLDGVEVETLLYGISKIFTFDDYVEFPLIMMSAEEGDSLCPDVEEAYMAAIIKGTNQHPKLGKVSRSDFYQLAKNSSAVVITGGKKKYGNILLTKGVTEIYCEDQE